MTQPRPEKGIVLPGFYPPGNGGTTGNFTPLEKKKKNLADGGGREDEEEE